ncbi:SDR family oxidoreductase [Actinocorallia sp. A-T 12471]|uniref:SDR family oxidoreductase n=1 Tax=Actinocorallia sp. A-T 12471 TaxID=3089813 RepID=UPI0029CBF4AE|nr:NAD(P)H-binding protein [Actinocorallia sp. A-T 12471]MDX6741108.1 NAD(P)H-binding protein [Actinocorallia sp. A-T 12471]
MRIAVAGGTGTVGGHVVAALAEAGHEPVVLSRAGGVDLVTGRGLAAALDGVEAVVDAANVTTLSRKKAEAFFTAETTHLLEAGARAGVRHHVLLSIVGIDRVPFGYYQGKVVQENLVEAGNVPWTVLRATQFHEFAAQTVRTLPPGPVAVVPRARVQPIAAREVAEALAELAVGGPRGRVPDLAGPREEYLPEMVRALLRHRGDRRAVLALPVPGSAGRAMREGGQLPVGSGPRGSQTYASWLAEQPK